MIFYAGIRFSGRMATPTRRQCVHYLAQFQAKNRLSELINRVQVGGKIAITRRCKIVARLVAPAHEDAGQHARDAFEGRRVSRQGVSLGRLSSKDLIRDSWR